MTTMLRDGLEWLADQLADHDSETITYRRGAASVSIQATLGAKLLKVTDQRGVAKTERADRDFILKAEDLILSGSVTAPRLGDVIQITLDGTTEYYEVKPVGSEAAWRYDPHKQTLRIHTKRANSVTPPTLELGT